MLERILGEILWSMPGRMLGRMLGGMLGIMPGRMLGKMLGSMLGRRLGRLLGRMFGRVLRRRLGSMLGRMHGGMLPTISRPSGGRSAKNPASVAIFSGDEFGVALKICIFRWATKSC